MQNHVGEESPDLVAFVWSVDEHGVDGDRPRGLCLTCGHCVVNEHAQLEWKEKEMRVNTSVDNVALGIIGINWLV